MKVKTIQDIDGFYKALDKCKGRVELITQDKDVLNLASKLTQFIGLTRVFNNPAYSYYEIVCYNVEDYEKIKQFLVPVEEETKN
ncbi:MAG: polya polymerase [Lachnospiraceae bacterium]